MSRLLIVSVVLIIGLTTSAFGQNLESIGKETPLTLSGGVSVNQIFYGVSGIDSRRDPYSFYTSGNLNFSLYGWSVPLTFAYSNQQSSFQQPFNQFGLHPTYKWITGHFGYASLNFSPYTLAGHLFLGAGVEANPGKFKISAMYGRLRKAIEADSLRGIDPTFRRIGYGFKAGYADGNDQIHFTLFRASDDEHSIQFIPEDGTILPEENLVVSVNGSKELFKRVVIQAEYAVSGITSDIRSPETSPGSYRVFSNVGDLFTPRLSSSYYNAFNSGITYQASSFSIGLGYERVDPGYRTLGAYYFNNDLVNYTINAATALLGGKINVAGNFGIQRDNLDGDKVSTLKRTVGSATVGYSASERLNLNASYSNFTTFTNIRSQFVDLNQLTPYDNLDTLNFTQISQNTTLNAHYIISSAESKRQNLAVNLTFQDASDRQGGVEQPSGSQFYLANTTYSVSFVPKNLTVSGSFNYNRNSTTVFTAETLGPTLAVSKALMERKMRVALSTSWNESYTNGQKTNKIINVRASGGYSLKQKHNLNLNLALVNRETRGENARAFTEFTGTLGYSYNFSSSRQ